MRRPATGPTRAPATFHPGTVAAFRYLDHEWDPDSQALTCRYALDDLVFAERITFDAPLPADELPARRALRLVHLLAGVSYFKAACPPVIDLGDESLTPAERRLLTAFYVDGLGEYAYRNKLDVQSVGIDAAPADPRPVPAPRENLSGGRAPLVPFGGGIDSIVSVEAVKSTTPAARLFVLGDFPAIEASLETAGLPVVRASRRIDPLLLELNGRGARNGHVPVTGILSAIAVAAAALHGLDEVVMSNEWSASQGNLEWNGRTVNHQWSKSLAFEELFRDVLAESVGDRVDYFSLLRPFTSVRIAERFAAHREYLPTFRSCNRAFHIDAKARRSEWCGECDKCAFVDLVLAPFVPAAELDAVFGGREPLAQERLRPQFETLLGLSPDTKPWECVGDAAECRVAAFLAAQRPDRAGNDLLRSLRAAAIERQPSVADDAVRMMLPIGRHHVPPHHATAFGLG